jgi:hypothetical protein
MIKYCCALPIRLKRPFFDKLEWSLLLSGPFFSPTDSAGNPVSEVFTNNRFFAPLPGATGPNPPRFNAQNNPFDTDSTFHVTDSTGKTTFTAQSAMQPVLYYSAKKYRNETFMNETFFFNQFTLVDENREPSHMRIDTPTVQQAVFNPEGTLLCCAGDTVSFQAYVKLPIWGSSLIVRTTAEKTLPGNATCTVSGNYTDSVRLALSWAIPSTAKGLCHVYIQAKDSNCNAPFNHHTQVYHWSFYVDSCGSSTPSQLSAIEQQQEVVIYPNPANEQVRITSARPFRSVKVYTMQSVSVIEQTFQPTQQTDIQTAHLPPGVYLLVIDKQFIRKLVIGR